MHPPPNDSIDDLKKRAGAGDASAQYRLAAHLSAVGDKGEAERMLRAAADQGFGDALYTLATRLLSDDGMDEAAQLLTRAADAGSAPAQRLLAVLYANGFGVAADWPRAISLVLGAAKNGVPGAMRELAMLLLARDPDDGDGAALIAQAAMHDPVAGAVAVRRACMKRRHVDVSAAARLLDLLKGAQYPNAEALAADFQAVSSQADQQIPAPDWSAIERKLSGAPDFESTKKETLCEAPSARVFRNAFTEEECEYVIASSARLLAPSLVADPATGRSIQDEYRTSLTAIMAVADLDLALTMFNVRLARLAARPFETAEALGVLYYAPGKEYKPHFDWLPEGPERDRGGQRVTTALLFLNDRYDGGETHFLSPDIRFKGAVGDVLVFDNVLPGGEPDRDSRHAGLAVKSGVKWLGSTWYREKKYRR